MLVTLQQIGQTSRSSSCDGAADEELVAAAKARRSTGFESLPSVSARILQLASVTHDSGRCEDIVQNFPESIRPLAEVRREISFSTWLAYCHQQALMFVSRRRALHEVPADDSSGDHGTTLARRSDVSPDRKPPMCRKR